MSKLSYTFRSVFNRFSTPKCPSCNSHNFIQVDSKALGIVKLLQCKDCYLRYRFPQNSVAFNKQFYEKFYTQKGLTTDLPSKSELSQLIYSNFRDSEKDFARFTYVLRQIHLILGRKLRILDFGANWGYTTYQLSQLDIVEQVYPYEISSLRSNFGKDHLRLNYLDHPSEVSGSIDVLFSSHVIEHMDNPNMLKFYSDLTLRDDGFVLLVCPNGSDSAKNSIGKIWSCLWGEVHPQYISDQYLVSLFSDYNGVIDSCDLLNLTIKPFLFSRVSSLCPRLSELVLLAQKTCHSI